MAKKKAENTNQKVVYSSLVVRAPQRRTSDVGLWRSASRSADMGRTFALYDLLKDLSVDGVLADAIGKRINAVLNAELIFQDKNQQSVNEIADIMDTLAWEDMIRGWMNKIILGRGGVEFDFRNGFNAKILPPENISLETKTILIDPLEQDKGVSYVNDDHIVVLGNLFDYGLLFKTAPFAIWKRGGFGDYAQWLEIFGMPQRIGKYSSYDTESRRLLEEALEKAGSAPWCVIPIESQVETVNNTGNGSSGTSYNDFRKACNEEMLITVLGQTLTTVQGEKGARSLGEVHQEVEEGLNKADMRYIQKILNTYLVPLLEKRGYPVSGGKFVFPAAVENLSVDEIVALSDIMPVPVSYLQNKFGIPEPKKGEAVAKRNNTENIVINETVTGKKAATTETVKSKNRDIFTRLGSFFVNAPTPRSGANLNFKRNWTGNIIAQDEKYKINITRIINEAIREIYHNRGDELINRNLFDITNNMIQSGINISLGEVEKKHPGFTKQFRDNTAVFSAFKNHQQTKEIANLLYDENGRILPFYKFKKLALQLSENYNVLWLQTEYNTAVRRSRMAVNMLKYMETAHLYPNLEYIETNAAHPRHSHLHYVGTILPIDHHWWDKHLPPSDWNCDCSVRPTDKDVIGVPLDDEDVNPVFEGNPAKTAEFINTKETPYYKHTDPDLRNDIIREGIRFQNEKKDILEVYRGKKGGYLEIVEQNKNEGKNTETYKVLADDGGRYTLLKPTNVENVKNPDAFNSRKGYFSDAKHPQSLSGKNAIQNSIKEASVQNVEEVVIRLERDYPSHEIYEGFKAALQGNRGLSIKQVILIRPDQKPLYLDAEKLRKRFAKK